MSQTQLSNIATFAGLIVIIAQQFGWILAPDKVTFVLAAVWSLLWSTYNYYQRFKKGDLTIAGRRVS